MKKHIQLGSIAIMLILLGGFLWKNHTHQQQIEQFSSLYSLLDKVKQHYHVYYLKHGRFPRSNEQANLPEPRQSASGIIKSIVALSDQRVFIELNLEQPVTLFLTPEINSTNQFLWHCRSPNLPENLMESLFDGCRSTRERVSLEKAIALQYTPRKKPKNKLDITLPPRQPEKKTPPKPCEDSDSSLQLLVHENGLGLWSLESKPTLAKFIPFTINRPNGIATLIGETVFAIKDGYIWYQNATSNDATFEKSSVWVKPGTQLHSAGRHLIWITEERNMFIGDVCHPPNVRIIHSGKLDLSRSEKIKRLEFEDNILKILSGYDSDWSRSSELNQFRIKENGSLVHLFQHRFRGQANGMHWNEPNLLIANGREGLAIYTRTSDHRWMLSQTLSAFDFAMDGLIQENTLWLADRSAGVTTFIRQSPSLAWEQLDQKQFAFPIFKLAMHEKGILASSATQHAWIPHNDTENPVVLNTSTN